MHEELIEDWETLLRDAGVDEDNLAELVVTTAERFAAIAARHEMDQSDEADDFEEAFDTAEDVNELGMSAQINFLIDQLGLDSARDHLEQAFEITLP